MKKPIWISTRQRLSFAHGSEMISPNSLCEFVFTWAIGMNLDVLFLQNPLNKIYKWRHDLELLLGKGWIFTQSSEVISPKSFCWFIFTRAIDMNLDVLFLQNPLNKIYKWRNYLELLLGNSFCGFVLTRAIDMNLDPPFLYNPLRKNEKDELIYYSTTIEFYTRFWSDISQLILWSSQGP